jgi:hypothetical protein
MNQQHKKTAVVSVRLSPWELGYLSQQAAAKKTTISALLRDAAVGLPPVGRRCELCPAVIRDREYRSRSHTAQDWGSRDVRMWNTYAHEACYQALISGPGE